jgi:hypothetical protein
VKVSSRMGCKLCRKRTGCPQARSVFHQPRRENYLPRRCNLQRIGCPQPPTEARCPRLDCHQSTRASSMRQVSQRSSVMALEAKICSKSMCLKFPNPRRSLKMSSSLRGIFQNSPSLQGLTQLLEPSRLCHLLVRRVQGPDVVANRGSHPHEDPSGT